jgi:hypothetical protein
MNRLLRGLRGQGECGFAILIGRWKHRATAPASPRRIGDIVTAALHLIEITSLGAACFNEPLRRKERMAGYRVRMGVDHDARHHFPGLSMTMSRRFRYGPADLGIAV